MTPKHTPGRAYHGGYLLEVRDGGTAGRFGCDSCVDCGKRPQAGARVFWLSSCLLCEPCARAAIAKATGNEVTS